MPLYEYKCSKCGAVTEIIQKVSDPPPRTCPQCGGKLHKLLSSPAIQFKGSGWYVTDYASKKPGAAAPQEKNKSAPDKSQSKKEHTADKKSTPSPAQ